MAWAQMLLLQLLLLVTAAAGSSQDEIEALGAQVDAFRPFFFDARARNNLTGWLPPQRNGSDDLCLWTGVICQDDRIISLTLPTLEGCSALGHCVVLLVGSLSPALAQLSSLVSLTVGSGLRGTLPPEWGSPVAFPSLRGLSIEFSLIGGPLPDSWGTPPAFKLLEILNLKNSGFNGTLPASWASATAFPALQELYLENNDLSGAVPAEWGFSESWPSLKYMYLGGNPQLNRCVPDGVLEKACRYPAFSKDCVGEERLRDCSLEPPPLPPLAAPPPPQPAPPPLSSTSSAPIGAIVGGVAGGGLAVLGVLAFFALRPGRGWLRTKPSTAGKAGMEGGLAGLDPAPEVDTLLSGSSKGTASENNCLPGSYATSGGVRHTPPPGSLLTGSLHSLQSDEMLTFIATTLATRKQKQPEPQGLGATNAPVNTVPDGMHQWLVLWDDIHIERQIGRGAFGKVYSAHWDATQVAVKVLINADNLCQEQDLELPAHMMTDLQEEAGVMARMRHPHIVSFMGLCLVPPCILTEMCARGSLYDLFQQAAHQPEVAAQLTWERRVGMAYDAARGLLYLHNRKPCIIHRDVKSPNMLVDEHWRVKIGDFNLSAILRPELTGCDDEGGVMNPIWLAPEVLAGQRAEAASDVWSFALVMLELLTWKLPWSDARRTPFQLRNHILDGGRPDVPARDALPGPDAPPAAAYDTYCQLMRECWSQEPAGRPTFAVTVARLGALLLY